MKSQEIKELPSKPLPELEKMRAENRDKLRHLMLDLAAGKVKNVASLRAIRKDIARIETAISAHRVAAKNDR